MSTQTATFTFALPEDVDADQMIIKSCSTETGTYTTEATVAYEYGVTKYEYASLNDTKWYKIEFNNTSNSKVGPISDAVYGGTFSNAAPFLAVSTQTDGANYANTQDVYDYSNLTTADISQAKVSAALRRARAIIDYRTAEMGLSRFDVFDTDTARRKYNATLRLVKEAEICFSLQVIYTNLSDDLIIANMRDRSGGGAAAGTVNLGQTSVSGDTLAERSESIIYLATLGQRYGTMARGILAGLDTNSVRLVGYDFVNRFPRFLFPFEGFH